MNEGFQSFEDTFAEACIRTGVQNAYSRVNIYAAAVQSHLNRLLKTNLQRQIYRLTFTAENRPPYDKYPRVCSYDVPKSPKIRRVVRVYQMPMEHYYPELREVTRRKFDETVNEHRYLYSRGAGYYPERGCFALLWYGGLSPQIVTLYNIPNLYIDYCSDFPNITKDEFWEGHGDEFGEMILHALTHQIYVAQPDVEKAAATLSYLEGLMAQINADAADDNSSIDRIRISGAI